MKTKFNHNLALRGFVDMTHPLSLRDGHQGREVKSSDSRVGLLHKVVAKDNVDVPRANRPPEHAHLLLDVPQHLDVRTSPPSTQVV